MTQQTISLFAREDTFFGVCQGLADDTGVPADLLRIIAAALFFLAPLQTFVGYFVLGGVVLFARKLFPVPIPSAIAESYEGIDPVDAAEENTTTGVLEYAQAA